MRYIAFFCIGTVLAALVMLGGVASGKVLLLYPIGIGIWVLTVYIIFKRIDKRRSNRIREKAMENYILNQMRNQQRQR